MATEALTEQVAEHLEEAAVATRRLDTRALSFGLGGLGIGLAVGFFFGYRFNREKIRAEAFEQSEEEVRQIREHYRQRITAAQTKPTVGELIEEKGYSDERLAPPVYISPGPGVVVPPPAPSKDKDRGWSYPRELSQRSVEAPYIIHQDEFTTNETEYNQVAYTYYAIDDVLVDEDNRPLPYASEVVGINNLRFGHGTDDDDVVFVRNSKLEVEMEICRVNQSYHEEVLGLDGHHDESDR